MGYSRFTYLAFVATLAIVVTCYNNGVEAALVPPVTWTGNWGPQERSLLEGNLRNEVNRADKRRIKHMVARVMKKDKEPESQSDLSLDLSEVELAELAMEINQALRNRLIN